MLGNLRRLVANDDLSGVMAAAKATVRTKLEHRPTTTLNSALHPCTGLPETVAPELLANLAGIIGVSPKVLRLDDRLGDILSAGRDELPSGAAIVLNKYGLGQRLQPFAYDLMHLAETTTSKSAWNLGRGDLKRAPRNEEEWIDTFMGMTVCEFLVFTRGDGS